MARSLRPSEMPKRHAKCYVCNRRIKEVPFLVLWSKRDPNKIEGYAHVECVPHKSKESEI